MGAERVDKKKFDWLEVLFVGLGIVDAMAFAAVILFFVTLISIVTTSAIIGVLGTAVALIGKMFRGSFALGVGMFGYVLVSVVLVILGGIVLLKMLKLYPVIGRAVKGFFAGTTNENGVANNDGNGREGIGKASKTSRVNKVRKVSATSVAGRKGIQKGKPSKAKRHKWGVSMVCLILFVVGLTCVLFAAVSGEMDMLWESLSDFSFDSVTVLVRGGAAE